MRAFALLCLAACQRTAPTPEVRSDDTQIVVERNGKTTVDRGGDEPHDIGVLREQFAAAGPDAIARAQLSHTQPCGAGICSTARDLVTWQKALESGAVGDYAAMTTPGENDDGSPSAMGRGIAVLRIGGHRAFVRSSATAFLASFPDDKLRIAIVGDTANAWTIVARELALPRPAAKPIDDLAPLAVMIAPPGRTPIATYVEGNRLWVRAPERTPLVHVGDHVFESDDRATRVRFEITAGVVTRMFYTRGDDHVAAKPAG